MRSGGRAVGRRKLILFGVLWALGTLLFAAGVIYVSSRDLRAHGGYDWIRQYYGEASDKWKDGDFGGCCGKNDCFPVNATFTLRDGVYGWQLHDGFNDFVPDKDTQPSHDPEGRHWRCYSMTRAPDGTLVPATPRMSNGKPCFFPSRGDF